MAWERNFEAKVMKVRQKELRYQKLNYSIEVSLLIWKMAHVSERSNLDLVECYMVVSFHKIAMNYNGTNETLTSGTAHQSLSFLLHSGTLPSFAKSPSRHPLLSLLFVILCYPRILNTLLT